MIINPRNLVTPSKSPKLHSHVVKGVSSPTKTEDNATPI